MNMRIFDFGHLRELLARVASMPASIADVMPEESNLHSVIPSCYPTGKGIFVQTVRRATKAGTPQALADFAEDLGLDWVMLLSVWQHKDRDRNYDTDQDGDRVEDIVEAAAALQAKEIKVWVWGWPHPGQKRIRSFVDRITQSHRDCRAEGIILNIEAPFYGRSAGAPRYASDAKLLMGELRSRLGGAPIGLSSYGAKFWHTKSFPWKELSERCDFGMPQIYDVHERHGPDYPERCVESWRENFAVVLPTLAASKRSTPREMRDKLNQTPMSRAISWWDMNHVRYSRERQAVIREMNWW